MKFLSRLLVFLFIFVLVGGIYFMISLNNFQGGSDGFWHAIQSTKSIQKIRGDINLYIKENLRVSNIEISDDFVYLIQDEEKFKIIYTFFGNEITSCKLQFPYDKSVSTAKNFEAVKEQLAIQKVSMEDIYVEDIYIYVKISDNNIRDAIKEYIGVDYSKMQDVLMYIIEKAKEV